MSRGNHKLTVLCFFSSLSLSRHLTAPIRQASAQLQTEANRLVYEFLWGRHQCAIQYYSLRVRRRGGGPFLWVFALLRDLHDTVERVSTTPV